MATIGGRPVRRAPALAAWTLGLVLTAALVSQCTPSPGCVSESRQYLDGSHVGFHIGMSAEAASHVVARHFGLNSVIISDATGDVRRESLTSRARSAMASPIVEYWTLPHRPPLCWSHERAIKLTLRSGVLTAILDDANLTLP